MATIVASRYAVLSVDDDDDFSSKKKKVPNKKPVVVKPQNAASVKPNGNSKKKKKQGNSQSQSSKSQKQNNGNSSKKKKQPVSEQWEEWKQKDAEFVEGNFEEDLSKAILLSKLDYEQKKDYYESLRKNEEEKKTNNKKNKKSQKVISLSEFDSIESQDVNKNSPESYKTEELEEPEFYNTLDADVKNDLLKEHILNIKVPKDSKSQESLTLVLYKSCIENQDREITKLKEEIEKLNIQLKNVKTRNTKLCQIIANGEMKDKAEVLMELDRLHTIKDELSSEVASLHIQLEQERSKVRQLTSEHKNKDKSKKHHGSSTELQ